MIFSGEFHLRLRQLEKSLLQALNDAKGKILDDDSIIATLETLKKEAADIGQKVIIIKSIGIKSFKDLYNHMFIFSG